MAKARKKKKSGYRPKVRITAFREAYRQLSEYAVKPENRRITRAARIRFLGIMDVKEIPRSLFASFIEWTLFHYRQEDGGTTVVERFVEDRGQFDEATRERILGLAHRGISGFFSVTLCEPDGWLVLQELGAERPGGYRVKMDPNLVPEGGTILEGRLVPWDDEWRFFTGCRRFSEQQSRSLATHLRQLRQKYDASEWRELMFHLQPILWGVIPRGDAVEALIRSAAQAPKMTKEGLEVEIIRSQLGKKDTARAIRMAETYLQKHPGNREAALLLAKAYEENDQVKEAIRILQQIVEAEPDNVETRLDLGELYSRMELWENAKQALQPALEFPGHQLASAVRCAYGSYLYHAGERDKGSDLMWLEVKNSPDNIQILHRAALTLFAGGETERLEEILIHRKEETGQLTPLAFFLLGQCYYADGKWQEALDALDSASHLSRSPLGLGMIGDCAFELGRYTRARQAYAELLRAAAEDLDTRQVVAAHFRLAYIEWRRGMHERALPHLVRAHEARPDDPDTLWLLAEIYLQRRETDRAMAITVNLHRICPDHPGLSLLIPRLFPHLVRRERRKPLYGASRPWRRFRCRARPRSAEAT